MTLDNITSSDSGQSPKKGSGKTPTIIFGLVIALGIITAVVFMMRDDKAQDLASSVTSGGCQTDPESGDVAGNVSFGDPINWNQPNRAEVLDGNTTNIKLGPSQTGKYLAIQDYDFAIPNDAVIEGIEVTIHRFADATVIRDSSVRLVKPGGGGGGFWGTIVGTDHKQSTDWPTTLTATTYGGPSDLWGETWTPADFNDAEFGMVISVQQVGGLSNIYARIDYITIQIFHDGGTTGCTLPVSWESFAAQMAESGVVVLNWSTANEKNNMSFNVERSADGNSFEALGDVPSQGDSESSQSYSYDDTSPLASAAYYRIRQIDLNGNSSYSNVIEYIPAGMEDAGMTTVYPNPVSANSVLKFDFDSNTDGMIYVEMYNLDGRVVASTEFTHTVGASTYEVQLGDVAPGTYVLQAIQGRNRYDSKVIVR